MPRSFLLDGGPEVDAEQPVGVRRTLRGHRGLENVRRRGSELAQVVGGQIVNVEVGEAVPLPGTDAVRIFKILRLVSPQFCFGRPGPML